MKKGGKKPSLTGIKDSVTKNNRKGNTNRKIKQGLASNGRYFSNSTEQTIEDDSEDRRNSGINDNSNEYAKDNVEVEVDKHQDERSNDSENESDDESGAEDDDKSVGDSNDDGIGSEDNYNGAENSDDDIGSDNDKESEDSCDNNEENGGTDDKESMEDIEEETKNDDNKMTSNKKQKISNTQHNKSTASKKVRTSGEKLPKFKETAKTNKKTEQPADTKSSAKKRKQKNEELENEITQVKKPHLLDNELESSLEKRKEERNARSLFLKDLPPNTTAEMVKKLSPEIINVRIPLEGLKHAQSLYAFIEFKNEEAAEKNYKKIKEKTLDNKHFIVDFCGTKSNYRRKTATKMELPVNVKKLFIPNLPREITIEELKKYIPEAKTFTTKQRGTKRLVFVSFENEKEAKKTFEETEKLIIHGKKLTVLFAYKKKRALTKMNTKKKSEIIPSRVEDEDSTEIVTKVKTKDISDDLQKNNETSKTLKSSKRKKKNFSQKQPKSKQKINE